MAELTKIVLTGGPSGGKTTAKEYIKAFCEQNGLGLVFVSESATEVLRDKSVQRSTEEFRKRVYENQLKNEREAEEKATGKTLIVCDRGTMDAAAYYPAGVFEEFLMGYGSNSVCEKDRYDAVYHLVSAACGAEEFYTNAGGHRTETLAEAQKLDTKTLAAWVGHNHLRVIENGVSFEEKMQNLIAEIAFQLGIPTPVEVEKKFLINRPDTSVLEGMQLCCGNEIVQTYLKCKPGGSRRVRKRGKNGVYAYYYTAKRKLENGVREEIEYKLTEAEYEELVKEADPECAVIHKTRYCLVHKGKYFEVDIFPFMKDTALMELELKSFEEEYEIPPFINVLEDVTENPEYTNHALSKKIK